MERSSGIFDTVAIRQSCWQVCDGDPGRFPVALDRLPVYRDNATRAQFFEVATFFGCVDICEDGYERERLLFVIPIAIAIILFGIVVVFLICYFCKCCLCYRQRQRRAKQQQLLTTAAAASGPYNGVTPATLSTLFSANSQEKLRVPPPPKKQQQQALQKQPDLNSSVRSNVSMNSWVNSTEALEEEERRRDSLMRTATRLGRRLAALDKQSEEEKRGRRRKRLKGDGVAVKTKAKVKTKTSPVTVLGDSTTGIYNPPMRF